MKQKDIDFPDCWEEVKPLEWLHLLKIRSRLMKQPGVALLDVKREWCAYVLKNRGYRFKSKVEDMLLVDKLAATLGWMWKVGEDAVELTYDSTENLLPVWRYLRGPASHGADLTFGEFRQAVAVMNKYNAGRDAADLRPFSTGNRSRIRGVSYVNRSVCSICPVIWGWCVICLNGCNGAFTPGSPIFVNICFPEFLSSTGWNSASLRYLNGAGKVRMYSWEPLKVWV